MEVSAEQTLLEALRGSGLRVASSCESGTCGTCKTGLLAGEAEHRDMVLTDEEKADHIMVCVSRAKSPELVLDLATAHTETSALWAWGGPSRSCCPPLCTTAA